jgi:hypothetical protein
VYLTLCRKSFPGHPGRLVKPEKRERLVLQELLVILEDLGHKGHLVKMDRLVTPEKKEHQDITDYQEQQVHLVSQVIMVRRERLAHQAKMDTLVQRVYPARTGILEGLDPKDLKVNEFVIQYFKTGMNNSAMLTHYLSCNPNRSSFALI